MTAVSEPALFLIATAAIGLPLLMAFSLVVLWANPHREPTQFFALFVVAVVLWVSGLVLEQSLRLLNADAGSFTNAIYSLVEIGYLTAAIATFIMTAVRVRAYTRRFRILAFVLLVIIVVYRGVVIGFNSPAAEGLDQPVMTIVREQSLVALFGAIFGVATLYLLWRDGRKLRSPILLVAIACFVIGQGGALINPSLGIADAAVLVCIAASLVVGFAILRGEVIMPLSRRASQVAAIRSMSLAAADMISQSHLLTDIAQTVHHLIAADGVAIYLYDDVDQKLLMLKHRLHLPLPLPNSAELERRLSIPEKVVRERRPLLVDRYHREWDGRDEFPFARAAFGSVLCAPLLHGDEVLGAIACVAGVYGQVFNAEDAYLLELLCAQSSVALAHHRSFERQRSLRQALEFSYSQLETIIQSTENGIIATRRNGSKILENRAAESLPKAIVETIEAILKKSRRQVLKQVKRGQFYAVEIEVSARVFYCHVTAVRDKKSDRIILWVIVLNDITSLKELERMQNEIIRMTSHDLKNPLQGALAQTELIDEDIRDGQVTEETTRSLQNVQRQLHRMERIIQGVLDTERVRNHSVNKQMHDLDELIGECITDLIDFAIEKQITLIHNRTTPAPIVFCDRMTIHHALINLIENAVKFTPMGGKITVECERSVEGDIALRVSDTGIGIASDVQQHIFDRFYRVQSASTDHITGTGLGLSIVKEIVERHDGSIDVTSTVGEGTTFTIRLPLEQRLKAN